MQDTFVRVTRSAYAFRSQGNGRAWIFRIARNLALNHVSRSNSNSLEAMIEQSGKEPQSSLTTEDSALSNVALNQAMLTLSEQEREIVYMHSVAGLKLSEIARVLDVPLGTVKWRHTGALKKLRAALSE